MFKTSGDQNETKGFSLSINELLMTLFKYKSFVYLDDYVAIASTFCDNKIIQSKITINKHDSDDNGEVEVEVSVV